MRMSITTKDNACTGATICAVTLNHLRYSAVYETSSIASVLGTMKPKRSTSTMTWFSGPKIALRISRNGPPASITTSMLPIAIHIALRTRERVCSEYQARNTDSIGSSNVRRGTRRATRSLKRETRAVMKRSGPQVAERGLRCT